MAKDKECTDIRVCVFNEVNVLVERYKHQQRAKGIHITKPQAAEELLKYGVEKYFDVTIPD